MPLPGPGWAIVFVGLGMLALEFKWAENADGEDAEPPRGGSGGGQERQPAPEGVRHRGDVLGIAAFVAAAILWDIPLLPV